MKKFRIEFIVGLFLVLGILALVYLSVNLTRFEMKTKGGYEIKAFFENVGGLKVGANVEVAGVPIGIIKDIELEDYRALVVLHIKKGIKIPDDSIASIKTKGLLGEKFLEVSPGASDDFIPAEGEIIDTQSPIDFEEALGKFIFGKVE
ncbi:MAG: outer membrane lipid asymmetry maintenance protein MlaD [Candidatus Aureabacteria bacterium]|nr:outer membrane lipid asymmetry maintenance protein MlaD [Candidatus Auribacterota bacterium]